MLRLSKALGSAGVDVSIVSTGVSLKMGFSPNLIYKLNRTEADGMNCLILPAVGLPIVGYVVEPVILSAWMFLRCLRRKPSALMVYNGTLATAVAVIIARLFSVRVIYDVEDVPDFTTAVKATGPERPRLLQHLTWTIASRIQRPLSYAIVAPSRRFLTVLGLTQAGCKPHSRVISGCMDVTAQQPRYADSMEQGRPLRVLFSGKLESEHGFDILLEAIRRILSEEKVAGRLQFHICGSFNGNAPRGSAFSIPQHSSVVFHGFVSDLEYRDLLLQADVGLALQRSSGIYRDLRTPSKAYEFLASGKLVVATRVGDLAELFPDHAVCLDPETGDSLAGLFRILALQPERFLGTAERGLTLARDQYSLESAGRTLRQLVTQPL